MANFVSSPNRRRLVAGMLLVAAVVLVTAARRTERPATAPIGGDFSACARLEGDKARACYGREVGRELSAVGDAPSITLAAPADSAEVTFTSTGEPQPLLCDLHARVGVVDAGVPSWVVWAEPLAEAAPR